MGKKVPQGILEIFPNIWGPMVLGKKNLVGGIIKRGGGASLALTKKKNAQIK